MSLHVFILFIFFLLLSAFFSSSETAFISANPYRLGHLEKKGSGRARLVQKLRDQVDDLLATILVGNTLVNVAASSVATFIFVSIIPNKNQAVLLATVATTLLILLFSEITPKTYAAYNSVKLSLLFARPLKYFIILFYPLVKTFTFLSRLIYPTQKKKMLHSRRLDEEEIRVLFGSGVKGISSLRLKMMSGVLDIGTQPVMEIMIPRPEVKAVNIDATLEDVIELIQSAEYSRFPVYKNRMDNIEGVFHAKDIIPFLVKNKEFQLRPLLRKPIFVPESAPLEKALLLMQESANHMAFVVDEFGNMEGILTLEDIIEEIVGEIQDEYDRKQEDKVVKIEEGIYFVKGDIPVKEFNQLLPIQIPAKGEYTTLAGFFLNEFGKLPREGESLKYEGHRFVIEKMGRRKIQMIRIESDRKKETS
jgi:putative hemolysin